MSPDDLTGRTSAGYRLEARVGEGGGAIVHRAQHPDHGVCALKLLRATLKSDPAAVKRLLRDAECARVRDFRVVRTSDYGTADGEFYLPPSGPPVSRSRL